MPASGFVSERALFLPFNRQTEPSVRLFCFPYAGGDANVFRDWVSGVPAGVAVIGVQYPGRSVQDANRAISSCEQLVAMLRSAIVPWLDRDFVFFGHSNGALISFELARSLEQAQSARHRHHFLSARAAAHLATGRKKISALQNEEFLRELHYFGGTPREVLEDALLMKLIAPRLRADFAIGENYTFKPGRKLGCDITTLRGENDHSVNGELVERWAELTTGHADHHVVQGDHFFVNQKRSDVLAIVRAKLEQLQVTTA